MSNYERMLADAARLDLEARATPLPTRPPADVVAAAEAAEPSMGQPGIRRQQAETIFFGSGFRLPTEPMGWQGITDEEFADREMRRIDEFNRRHAADRDARELQNRIAYTNARAARGDTDINTDNWNAVSAATVRNRALQFFAAHPPTGRGRFPHAA